MESAIVVKGLLIWVVCLAYGALTYLQFGIDSWTTIAVLVVLLTAIFASIGAFILRLAESYDTEDPLK